MTKKDRTARNRRIRSAILSLSALSFLPILTVMRGGVETGSAGLTTTPQEAVVAATTPATSTRTVASQSISGTAQIGATTTHTRTSAS